MDRDRVSTEGHWYASLGKKDIPRNFPNPNRIGTIVFWIIIVLIAAYAFRAERSHSACYDSKQKECTSHFYRAAPEEGDSNIDLLQRVENGTRVAEEGVTWRRHLLISFVLSILIPIVIVRRWPSPLEFLIEVVIIYTILTAVNNFCDMHFFMRIREDQLRSVDQLRHNLGYSDLGKQAGIYGPPGTFGYTQTHQSLSEMN
jgi:hypothetical protein